MLKGFLTMFVLASTVMGASSMLLAAGPEAWPAPVPQFVPPVAGEHPRLLFRKNDVPALRQKAQTPVGKAMIARLKYLLGGGDAMPAEFNTNPPINIGAKGPGQLKPGAFTVSHSVGFGLLYQLTGDKKYADLARQCLDKVLDGQVDRDERYSWKKPGTGFRYSGVHQSVAITYDLCYDAWPNDYRLKVIQEIQTNAPTALQSNGSLTLEALAHGVKYPPSSNHFGAYIAGPGFAALAIKGDPGADSPRMEKVLDEVNGSLRRLFTNGFGDGGWFGEGSGSDKTASMPGIDGLMQAMRLSAGKDWCEGAPNGRMVILTRALELVPTANAVDRPARGHYAYGASFYRIAKRSDFRDRGGWSSDGLFCIGIGALPERYRPGMAWIYDNFVEPDVKPVDRIYEARLDPITAVYAFVNWPIDKPAENPTKVFPLAIQDTVHGYVLCRNQFQDQNDCLFTGLARRGPVGYHKERAPQEVMVWGLGLRTSMGRLSGETTHWQPATDGSACFTMGGVPWAVDYSNTSGAAAVIVNIGGAAGKPASSATAKATAQTLTLGTNTVNLLILSAGNPPEAKVQGDKIILGGQTISTDGKTITLAKFSPMK